MVGVRAGRDRFRDFEQPAGSHVVNETVDRYIARHERMISNPELPAYSLFAAITSSNTLLIVFPFWLWISTANGSELRLNVKLAR